MTVFSIIEKEPKVTNNVSYEHGETLKHFKIDLKKNKKFSSVEVKKNFFHYKTPKSAKNDQN